MDIIWKGGRLNWTFHNYEPTLHFLASFPHMSSLFQYCPWSTNLNQLSFNLTLRGCNHLKKNLRTKKKINNESIVKCESVNDANLYNN
jgi:hypothetical protein